jgi:hypothetical protein
MGLPDLFVEQGPAGLLRKNLGLDVEGIVKEAEISAKKPENRRCRLDKLMVQKGLAESREKAKAMIMAGLVQVNDRLVDKAGHLFSESAAISSQRALPPVCQQGRHKTGWGHQTLSGECSIPCSAGCGGLNRWFHRLPAPTGR